MESTCWQLRHRPFQSLNSHHLVIGCAVKILEILLFVAHAHHREQRFIFSALGRAVQPLLMILLRRIQNIACFGRLGVGNVSPVTIFGIFADFGATYLCEAGAQKGEV